MLSVMSSKPYTSALPSYVIDSFSSSKAFGALKALPRSSLSSSIENLGTIRLLLFPGGACKKTFQGLSRLIGAAAAAGGGFVGGFFLCMPSARQF